MPYGPACREFSDALSSWIRADGRIPTILMGDLNFPEEVPLSKGAPSLGCLGFS